MRYGTSCNCEGVTPSICPVIASQGDSRASRVAHKIRWDENLNTVLLFVAVILRIGPGYKDTTVIQEDSFRMVKAVNSCISHDSETSIDWFSRVIENGVVIRVCSQAEATSALMSSVQDEVGTIRQGYHAN